MLKYRPLSEEIDGPSNMFPEFNMRDRPEEANMTITTIDRPSGESEISLSKSSIEDLRDIEALHLHQSGEHRVNPLDKLVAILTLIPGLPVMLIVLWVVKLTSRGPGFYSQLRSGREGNKFFIHKIRSMTWNCESQTGAVWATRNDPRITRIGRFIRATHLDELPQLFNVLDGEMAIVGPRPERPEIIEKLVRDIPGYLDRLEVLPGVTGLAQVCTGADQTIEDVRLKLEYDRLYIRKQSAWLDLRIMFCTILKMLHLNFGWVRRLLIPESLLVHSKPAIRLAATGVDDNPSIQFDSAESRQEMRVTSSGRA